MPPQLSEEARTVLLGAGPTDLAAATGRLSTILAYLRGEGVSVTTTSEFLNQLRGNTQASREPRQMTREVDPKRLAVWTLERFAARLSEYVRRGSMM